MAQTSPLRTAPPLPSRPLFELFHFKPTSSLREKSAGARRGFLFFSVLLPLRARARLVVVAVKDFPLDPWQPSATCVFLKAREKRCDVLFNDKEPGL